jgi:hypothetical protein
MTLGKICGFALAAGLLLGAGPAHAGSCSGVSVDVRNVKLFEACHCKGYAYPELQPVLKAHGIRVERRGNASAWSEQVKGEEWFYCSISLKWVDRAKRQDAAYCGQENRRRIVDEVKAALKHPVAINSPSLSCY